MPRYESVLCLPTPEQIRAGVGVGVADEDVIEKIREVAFPTQLHDGRIHIEWNVVDEWDLRGMVDEVRIEVESMLNAGLVWDRPTLIKEQS